MNRIVTSRYFRKWWRTDQPRPRPTKKKKKEIKLSTKKPTKKCFSFFLGRERVFFLFFLIVIVFSCFSWSLSESKACFLVFLISCFLLYIPNSDPGHVTLDLRREGVREELSYIEMLPHLIITTAAEPELKPSKRKLRLFCRRYFTIPALGKRKTGTGGILVNAKKTNKFSTNYECIYGRKK